MIFTSLQFLFFLLIVISAIHLVKTHKYQVYILLFASYVFYGAWNPYYILLIILTSFIGWAGGYLIDSTENVVKRKIYLSLSIFGSLAILGYFKYAGFVAENLALLLGMNLSAVNIILPVGISFFTFQSMSYTIDLYRRRIPVCKSPSKFFLFVAFFPQLVAGPIVRAADFLPQLNKKLVISYNNILFGVQIFLIGAFQKVVIANNLSPFVDKVFLQPEIYSGSTLWLASISYSLQIFCDFSGYSLMAIGVAKLFGFTLPENFRMPYVSRSISEFWRRWHISLSFWLRDYLYISLGGSRLGKHRTLFNLIITMVLGGLWHGASWNFVLWGFIHGMGLVVHKLWEQYSSHIFDIKYKELFLYRMFAWFLTYLFVVLLWIPFRSSEFNHTVIIYEKLFTLDTGIQWDYTYGILLILLVAIWNIGYIFKSNLILKYPYKQLTISHLLILGVLLLAILLFSPLNVSPFIYFQF